MEDSKSSGPVAPESTSTAVQLLAELLTLAREVPAEELEVYARAAWNADSRVTGYTGQPLEQAPKEWQAMYRAATEGAVLAAWHTLGRTLATVAAAERREVEEAVQPFLEVARARLESTCWEPLPHTACRRLLHLFGWPTPTVAVGATELDGLPGQDEESACPDTLSGGWGGRASHPHGLLTPETVGTYLRRAAQTADGASPDSDRTAESQVCVEDK